MSNVPIEPSGNLVLTPDWEALAKIGKTFHLIYVVFICFLLILIGSVLVNLYSGTFVMPFILLGMGVLALALFGCVVWIIAMIRFWATPESIVPGGGIGRAFVILCVISFLIGIAAGAMKETDLNVSLMLQWIGGILNLASQIVFLVYVWRLASAIGSKRVKSCIKWIVYGTIAIFVLAFMTGALSTIPATVPVGVILPVGLGILGLAVILSWLNLFGYMPKDIQNFIAYHTQMYFTNLNQSVENPSE